MTQETGTTIPLVRNFNINQMIIRTILTIVKQSIINYGAWWQRMVAGRELVGIITGVIPANACGSCVKTNV